MFGGRPRKLSSILTPAAHTDRQTDRQRQTEIGVTLLKAMAANWSALSSSALSSGYFCHSHHGTPLPWTPVQIHLHHLQQILVFNKLQPATAASSSSAAAAQHSNARIAKSNRRSRFGESLPTFSLEDELEGSINLMAQLRSAELETQEQEERDMGLTTKKSQQKLKKLGIEFKRVEKMPPMVTRKVKVVSASALEDLSGTTSAHLSVAGTNGRKVLQKKPSLPGTKKLSRHDWEEQAYQIIQHQKLRDAAFREQALELEEAQKPVSRKPMPPHVDASGTEVLPQLKGVDLLSEIEDALFDRLLVNLRFEPKWRALVCYLHQLGLGEEDFRKLVDRHRTCLQTNAIMVKERVEYLVSVGVERDNLSKLIVRHPQIIEYTVEKALKPRIQYLKRLGVPDSKLGRVISVAPSLLECSLNRSLKPRVEYLKDVVGIKESDIGLIITRSPQVLTQSIEDSLEPRVEFFMVEMGVTKEKLAKMVTRHPQLLHYSVEDGICPRVDYLKSIGLSKDDILKVFARLTQVLSLSIENCLKPKYEYLVNELNGGPHTVTSFPAYFSLSLEQRIKPRHRYLAALQRLPKGPFPMKSLAVTDSCFCKQFADTTVEEYQAFRNELLLSNFAKQFEWKNKVHI